jgi:hypothetical protein
MQMVGMIIGGGFRVEDPNAGTFTTSASVNPVASRIFTPISSKPLLFADLKIETTL